MDPNASPTSFTGPRQLEIGTAPLAYFTGNVTTAAVTIPFRVRNPDSRCRIKVSILFTPISGAVGNIAAKAMTLWLFEAEKDRSGQSGAVIPCVDLDGSTQIAPIAIPKSAGLGGYSYEATTAGDYIAGEITVPIQIGDGSGGALTLQTQLQPDGQRLPDKDWDEVRAEFRASPPPAAPLL
jgi:hypothetical protein